TQIEDALHPEFVALFLRRPHEPCYCAVATAPVAAHLEPLSSESKAAGLLQWLQKPIQIPHDDRASLLRQLPQEEIDWLRRVRIVLPDAAERFESEARLAAALVHPNVVTVHDIGVTGAGRPFFIMELLEGVTLRDELRREKRLAPARALHILRGVSAAVDAAHRRQMIHRDLKPENVFLCRGATSEVPRVLDFGLAKSLEAGGRSVQTRTGLVAGTPPHMAPEP